jgi:hypothetical protein
VDEERYIRIVPEIEIILAHHISMKALRFIYYLSLASILVWILLSAFLALAPIELSYSLRDSFVLWRLLFIPLAIVLTLCGTLPQTKELMGKIAIVSLTLFAGFIVWVILVMSLFTEMCAYSTVRYLYERRNDHSDKIVVRDYGCGATDSSPASISISRIKYVTHDIMIIKEKGFDTITIDHSQWKKAELAP